jgi:predicted flap endonuclease-1-like 5' DNA nuclease
MKITRGLFYGFIVGAVVGLVIYLRMQRQQQEAFLDQGAMRIEIPGRDSQAEQPAQKAPGKPAAAPSPKSDVLTTIRGIGPVYARRLQAAGILTFANLAGATPAQLAEIIGPRAQLAEMKGWITAAKKLA